VEIGHDGGPLVERSAHMWHSRVSFISIRGISWEAGRLRMLLGSPAWISALKHACLTAAGGGNSPLLRLTADWHLANIEILHPFQQDETFFFVHNDWINLGPSHSEVPHATSKQQVVAGTLNGLQHWPQTHFTTTTLIHDLDIDCSSMFHSVRLSAQSSSRSFRFTMYYH
jgi:hypothetical protein